MGENVDLVPQVSEELFGGAGTAPAVTLGGVDAQGEDAVNDLTYIMLRVTELLKLREPNMNARYHYEKNTKAYRNRVCEVIANTKAVPAFHNDVENIKTLINQGVTPEHARDYSIIGCVELAVSGRSYDASSSIILNLSAPLEMALYSGRRYITGDEQFNTLTGDPATFRSFDEFRDAFQTQARWLIDQAVGLNEKMAKIHQETLPTPLLSALFDGPLVKGKDLVFGGAVYNSSGATHVGFADTVDSLNAIKMAVYKQKYCSFGELLEAIRDNFEKTPGQKQLRQFLLNKTPRYGTSVETENGESRNMIRFLYEIYQGYTNYRGGKYRPAYWTMTNHSGQGKITHALPTGRKANVPFASGITPVSGVTKTLTECLNSVASLGSEYIPGGEALNIKFTAVKNEQDIRRFGDYVEAYFIKGGQQVQFNIMSSAMLKDAKAHPENYGDLLVRVSGYSAYFNDLNDVMKDELITRSEYDIEKNGEAVLYE
jgi:formate C-acetyltransferase